MYIENFKQENFKELRL